MQTHRKTSWTEIGRAVIERSRLLALVFFFAALSSASPSLAEPPAKPLTPSEAAMEAYTVNGEYCMQLYEGKQSKRAEVLQRVGKVWNRVSNVFERTEEPFLLYWLGVLNHCIDQEDSARDHFQKFIRSQRGSDLLADQVRDAKRRLRFLLSDETSKADRELSMLGLIRLTPKPLTNLERWRMAGKHATATGIFSVVIGVAAGVTAIAALVAENSAKQARDAASAGWDSDWGAVLDGRRRYLKDREIRRALLWSSAITGATVLVSATITIDLARRARQAKVAWDAEGSDHAAEVQEQPVAEAAKQPRERVKARRKPPVAGKAWLRFELSEQGSGAPLSGAVWVGGRHDDFESIVQGAAGAAAKFEGIGKTEDGYVLAFVPGKNVTLSVWSPAHELKFVELRIERGENVIDVELRKTEIEDARVPEKLRLKVLESLPSEGMKSGG